MGTRRRSASVGAASVIGTCLVGGIALASGGSERFRADMDGQQEVPPADLDGEGKSRVEINADGEVCFSLRFEDIGTPNRGHIHEAAAGVNGGIVVGFFELRPQDAPATDPRHDDIEDGRFEDCVMVTDEALLARIIANPENFYVNLHNTRFPGGAIRGQLD